MRKVLFILMSLFVLASCSKDDSWSPEYDIETFIKENPYSIIFENRTDGDLSIKCEGLAASTIKMLHKGEVSDTYRGKNAEISVEYKGEGSHFSTVKKNISLSKEKTTRMFLTYP